MSYSHKWGAHWHFLAPPPVALGRGQKVKYHFFFNFNYKANFKDFYTKLCVFSQIKDTKIYQTGFLFYRLGHALGVGLGCLGVKCPSAVCPLCYLSLNHSTEFNEIRCVSFSHEWGCYGKLLLIPAIWGPPEGSKGQKSFNFNYNVNFKDFLYETLCVFSQMKDTNHIRRDFYSVAWVMPQGRDFWALWVPRWSVYFQTWSCGISNRQG